MKNCRRSQVLSCFILFLVLIVASSVLAQEKIDRILKELREPSGKVVLVVSHRGDWRNFPENTIEAINGAVEIGADIVEIDVQKTKDGHFVLMHDATVDRMTNGKGKVADLTLEEIKKLKLRNGIGHATQYRVPTLREALTAGKGRVMFNLDKVGSDRLDDVYAMAREIGVEHQIIFKSGERYEKVRPILEKAPKALFMPIVSLDRKDTLEKIEEYEKNLKPFAYEFIPNTEPSEHLDRIKVMGKAGTHIWINSLWDSLCLGHCDDKAVDDPDANWGWILDQGATMIQTDRPARLIKYLEAKNRRWE